MNVVVLRFANVYGPNMDCLRMQPPVVGYIIRELFHGNAPVLHSDGGQKRDFIYVDDLIEMAMRVRGNTGFDCVNVSTNTAHSIKELYEIIARIMGKEHIRPVYAGPAHYWSRYPGLYEGAYPIREAILDHEVNKSTLCDNAYAMEKYGWTPAVGFEEGLRRTVEFTVGRLGKG